MTVPIGIKALRLAVLQLLICLFMGAGLTIAHAAPQAPSESPQQLTVLRTGRLVAGNESPTASDASCSISGAGSGATMECHRIGTSTASYHFNTALVADAKGTAYVIACRVPLVMVLCAKLETGSVIEARLDKELMAIDSGNKVRRYQILTKQSIGPLPVTQLPSAQEPAQAPSKSPAATTAKPSSSRTEPRLASQATEPASDSSAPCTSATGACVSFISEPSGADIYVDGKFMGDTPSMIILPAGSHELRVEAGKFMPWTRKFEASSGNKVTIHAPLQPQP